jgi:hypothetical protein
MGEGPLLKFGWNRVELSRPKARGFFCYKEVVDVTDDGTGATHWALANR